MVSGLVQAGRAAVPALAQKLGMSAPGVGDDSVRYGMTMWFKVTVDDGTGAVGLGEWSTCRNLGVTFGSEVVKQGLGHADPRFEPTALTFDDVTLERAISSDDSGRVRRWLADVAQKWVLADDGAAPNGYAGATVTIQLFGAPQGTTGSGARPIAEWDLLRVYPKSWKGPSLDAGSDGIATEQLVLMHGGWRLRPGPSGGRRSGVTIGARGATGQPGLLTLVDSSRQGLDLQYQPSEITMKKSSVHKESAKGAISDPGKISFDFTVRMEGVTAVDSVRTKLFEWLRKNEIIKGDAAQNKFEPLDLRIGTGPAKIEMKVWLRSVSTTFLRFSAGGVPSRATFKIELEEVAASATASGGTPEAAGPPADPGRASAAANGVDDPLRAQGRPRAGTV